MNQYVVGMSGHIDHGKTTLIKALTGKNTDILKEEIERGMTVDVGFAFLNDKITLIDVPGHKRFLKNMLVGVNSIDMALLVVAADDGIMPQTIEHINIIKLLNIRNLVVAVNKIDLVDDDWLQLVHQEIDEKLDRKGFVNFKIVHISAFKNSGIDHLRNIIEEEAKLKKVRNDKGFFRMHIDRAFIKKGFGTVVTGTIDSGSVNIGDKVQLLPSLDVVKVRGLQTHDSKINCITMGSRVAINFQSINNLKVSRGMQIASLESIPVVNSFIASVSTVDDFNFSLKHNQRIRVHIGTKEVLGRIFISDYKALNEKSSDIVLIRLEEELPISYKDKFIIRQYSPQITLGGGEVVDNLIFGKWKLIKIYIDELRMTEKNNIIEKLVTYRMYNPLKEKEIEKLLGMSKQLINSIISDNQSLELIKINNNSFLVSVSQKKIIENRVEETIKAYHLKNKFEIGIPKEELIENIRSDRDFINFIIDKIYHEKRIKIFKDKISMFNYSFELTKEEQIISDDIISLIHNEHFITSSIDEIASKLNKNSSKIKEMIKSASSANKLLVINGQFIFSMENINDLFDIIKAHFVENESMTVSDFKLLAKTSRKYAVPLLEYFDREKITLRIGNERKLLIEK